MSTARMQERLKAAGFYPGRVDDDWGPQTDKALTVVIDLAKAERSRREQEAMAVAVAAPFAERPPPLTSRDYADAAGALDGDKAKLLAVKAVESGGGWFTDVRAEILDLDGPGGFLAGPDLPKILFEAHLFSQYTQGRFNKSHPDLSSPRWNRLLYMGGQAEYTRLHRAMQLDVSAALRATSWGMFQILGANHKAAGFADVMAYVEAMKRSERDQLLAFVSFIKNTPGLLAKYRKISVDPKACEPFCAAYNGPSYATHNYHSKIAAEYRRALAAG
jgi:hypothetical protein